MGNLHWYYIDENGKAKRTDGSDSIKEVKGDKRMDKYKILEVIDLNTMNPSEYMNNIVGEDFSININLITTGHPMLLSRDGKTTSIITTSVKGFGFSDGKYSVDTKNRRYIFEKIGESK